MKMTQIRLPIIQKVCKTEIDPVHAGREGNIHEGDNIKIGMSLRTKAEERKNIKQKSIS